MPALSKKEILGILAQVTGSKDSDADRIDLYPGVTELNLSNKRYSDVSVISSIGLPDLRILSLQFNHLRDLQGLRQILSLETLNASHNHLSSLDGIQGCAGIRMLRASHNRLTCLDAVDSLAFLEELWLNDNALSTVDSLAPLARLPRLKHLLLQSNPVWYSVDRDLLRLYLIDSLPTLQTLNGEPITDQERFDAREWLSIPKIRVEISNLGLPQSLHILPDSPGGKELRNKLTLSRERVGRSLRRLHTSKMSPLLSPSLGCRSLHETSVLSSPVSSAAPLSRAKRDDKTVTFEHQRVSPESISRDLPLRFADLECETHNTIGSVPLDAGPSWVHAASTIRYPDGKVGLQIWSDGGATIRWPNGQIAVLVDYDLATEGFAMFAYHKNGQPAVSISGAGYGQALDINEVECLMLAQNMQRARVNHAPAIPTDLQEIQTLASFRIRLSHHMVIRYSPQKGDLELGFMCDNLQAMVCRGMNAMEPLWDPSLGITQRISAVPRPIRLSETSSLIQTLIETHGDQELQASQYTTKIITDDPVHLRSMENMSAMRSDIQKALALLPVFDKSE